VVRWESGEKRKTMGIKIKDLILKIIDVPCSFSFLITVFQKYTKTVLYNFVSIGKKEM